MMSEVGEMMDKTKPIKELTDSEELIAYGYALACIKLAHNLRPKKERRKSYSTYEFSSGDIDDRDIRLRNDDWEYTLPDNTFVRFSEIEDDTPGYREHDRDYWVKFPVEKGIYQIYIDDMRDSIRFDHK